MNIELRELLRHVDLYFEGRHVGEANVFYTEDAVMLTNFMIRDEFQGKGLGQAFLKLLIDKYDVSMLNVDADNERAIHIYKKHGFKEVGGKYYTHVSDKTGMYKMVLDN